MNIIENDFKKEKNINISLEVAMLGDPSEV